MKKIGLIGCGHWGKNYLRVLNEISGIELIGLSEWDDQKRIGLSEKNTELKAFKEYGDLLALPGLDAVVVATPAITHFQIIKDALLNGLDVLSEKPITLNSEEAAELALLSQQKSLILMVSHTFLFNSSVIYLKKIIDSGILGDLYYVKTRRTHLGLIRNDVNVLWDLAPHEISILKFLFNETPKLIQSVASRVYSKVKEDIVFVNAIFPSGLIANMHFSWLDTNKERTFEIVGSKGRVVFDDLNVQEPVKIYFKGVSSGLDSQVDMNFGEFKYIFRDGDILSPNIPISEPLKKLCNEFLGHLNARTLPYSDAFFSADVVKALEEMQQSVTYDK